MKDLTRFGIVDYLGILWRRRWYLLVTTILVSAGATIYISRMPDIYRSASLIGAVTAFVSEDYVRPTVRISPEDRINAIREQIQSRTFLESMIERFSMYGYGTHEGFVMEKAVDLVRRQITVERGSGSTVTVSFIAPDPQFARTITQFLADELIRKGTAQSKEKTIATDQFLDEQLRQTTEALTAQEEKIKQFKNIHLGGLPEQSAVNMNALTSLHTQLTATETAIQQAREQQRQLSFRRRITQVSQDVQQAHGITAPAPREAAPSAQEIELERATGLLSQYLVKYTSDHPDVIALKGSIEKLAQQINENKARNGRAVPQAQADAPQTGQVSAADVTGTGTDSAEATFQFEADNLKDEIERREKEQKQILQQIAGYQKKLNLVPALEQELASLMRDLNVLNTQFQNLQRQKFNTQLAATVETDKKNETYRIIDEPNLPVKPVYPNRIKLMLIAIAGSIAAGIGAAVGREVIDSSIASEQEAELVLGLPVLVSIPTIPDPSKKPYKAKGQVA